MYFYSNWNNQKLGSKYDAMQYLMSQMDDPFEAVCLAMAEPFASWSFQPNTKKPEEAVSDLTQLEWDKFTLFSFCKQGLHNFQRVALFQAAIFFK